MTLANKQRCPRWQPICLSQSIYCLEKLPVNSVFFVASDLLLKRQSISFSRSRLKGNHHSGTFSYSGKILARVLQAGTAWCLLELKILQAFTFSGSPNPCSFVHSNLLGLHVANYIMNVHYKTILSGDLICNNVSMDGMKIRRYP